MDRRAFLAAIGALGAGCVGGGGDGDGGADATSTRMQTRTRTTTPTATETATVTDTPTATATATPIPEPDPASFSGQEGAVTDTFDIQGGLAVFELSHDGESNFQTELVPDGAGRSDLLTNAIGAYDGRIGQYAAAGSYALDITANGSWSATVSQPRYEESDLVQPPLSESGRYAAVLGPIQFSGLTTVAVEARGEGALSVWLRTHRGEQIELISNGVAPYTDEAAVNETGVGLLTVETNQTEWSISVD